MRLCRGRNVDLGDRHMQQCVAHRAADDARLFAILVEQRQQSGNFILLEPGGVGEVRRLCHRVVPGTNLPFSMCAGT